MKYPWAGGPDSKNDMTKMFSEFHDYGSLSIIHGGGVGWGIAASATFQQWSGNDALLVENPMINDTG